MRTNPLMKATDPAFDRSKWSLQEHCDYANAQMILKEIPEYRRKKGLQQIRWVIRDGRIVLES
jgi:hypothetical protein